MLGGAAPTAPGPAAHTSPQHPKVGPRHPRKASTCVFARMLKGNRVGSLYPRLKSHRHQVLLSASCDMAEPEVTSLAVPTAIEHPPSSAAGSAACCLIQRVP